MIRVWQKAREEVERFHFRVWAAERLLSPLPPYVGSRVRAEVLRAAGFRIGRGTMFWGMPEICGPGDIYRKLQVGEGCWINLGCHFELGAEIRIGDRVSFGHEVMLLTSTHEVDQGTAERRAVAVASKPVVIGDGAWLGARCTVLPGVTIGPGAVVAAGAVVHRDVPRDTVVAGVPARVVRELP